LKRPLDDQANGHSAESRESCTALEKGPPRKCAKIEETRGARQEEDIGMRRPDLSTNVPARISRYLTPPTNGDGRKSIEEEQKLSTPPHKAAQKSLDEIRSSCNPYELGLMDGVVDAGKVLLSLQFCNAGLWLTRKQKRSRQRGEMSMSTNQPNLHSRI
jgi:hypothetical protein